MRYFKPFSTLAVGIAIGVFVVPAVRARMSVPGA